MIEKDGTVREHKGTVDRQNSRFTAALAFMDLTLLKDLIIVHFLNSLEVCHEP